MSPTRRQFLLGGGAAVVVAGAGAVGGFDLFDHARFERGLNRLGLAQSPDRTFPDSGSISKSGTFRSRFMDNPVSWTVSHPPGTEPIQGIIFCLHAKGGNHSMAFSAIDVPDGAASVGLRVAVAGVDGGHDTYWHKRTDGTDSQAMLLEEFVPMVEAMFTRGLPLILMGWSMGGYGALLTAEVAHGRFVAVLPASPALWLSPGETAPGAFDSPADFYANDVYTGVGQLAHMDVALAVGTDDPFYDADRILVSKMDFPHHAFYGAGFHDVGYWRSVAPDQLRTLHQVLS